jgi:hypothetical protein
VLSDYCHEHHEIVYDLRERSSRQIERVQESLNTSYQVVSYGRGQEYAGPAANLCSAICSAWALCTAGRRHMSEADPLCQRKLVL